MRSARRGFAAMMLVSLFVTAGAALLVSALASAVTPGAAPRSFPDTEGHWSADLVGSAAAAGYVHGFPDGTFRPDAAVTRAEGLKLVAAGFGLHPALGPSPPFADLEGHWLTGHGWIQAALDAGIVAQQEAFGRFDPDVPASREDLAMWAVRALKGESAAQAWSGLLPFRDAPAVSRVGHIGLATQRGIIIGYPDGTFRPRGGATRAEAVAILERARHLPPFDLASPPGGPAAVPPGSPDWRGRLAPDRTFRAGDVLSLRLSVALGSAPITADWLAEGTAAVQVLAADAAGAVLEASLTGFGESPGLVHVSRVRYWHAAGAWEISQGALDAGKVGFSDRDFWAMIFFPGPVGATALSGMGETTSVTTWLPGEPGPAGAFLEVVGYGVDEGGAAVATWAARMPALGMQGSAQVDALRPWTRTGMLERLQEGRWERWHWHVVAGPS